jgi:hypothetical protein
MNGFNKIDQIMKILRRMKFKIKFIIDEGIINLIKILNIQRLFHNNISKYSYIFNE